MSSFSGSRGSFFQGRENFVLMVQFMYMMNIFFAGFQTFQFVRGRSVACNSKFLFAIQCITSTNKQMTALSNCNCFLNIFRRNAKLRSKVSYGVTHTLQMRKLLRRAPVPLYKL